MTVNQTLSPYGLQLYLYLAANADHYEMALSPEAADKYAGIKSTSFYKYLKLLEVGGYLVWRKGNCYDFYTSPRPEEERTHPDRHFDSDDINFAHSTLPNEPVSSQNGYIPSSNEEPLP